MQQTQPAQQVQNEQPTQTEHKILKELSNPQKTLSLFGIDLETRQFALIAALLAPLALLFRTGFFELLGLTGLQNLMLVAPIVIAVFCFAFVPWQGRDLSFIAQKKLQSAVREKILIWRARPPNSVMWLRDSVQRYLPAEEPVWDMLKTNNGTYLRIIEIEASSLSLTSEEQQERMRSRLAEAYTAFDFPIAEITRSRPSAMGTYITRLQQEMEEELGRSGISEQEAIKLRAFGQGHIGHLKDIVSEKHAYEHKSFVVITYNPMTDEEQDSSPVNQIKDMLTPFIPFVGRPRSKRATRKGQEEATAAYRKLAERVESIKEYYGRLGLTPTPLDEYQALELIREEAGGANLSGVRSESGAPAETQTPVSLGPTITLTAAQHEKLSEKAIRKHIDAAEEVRSEDELLEASGQREGKGADSGRSPQVVGLGELAVNDRIAPDAVEIGSDMLRVGSSYHRTLYIYDLPESVRIGFLQSLAEMKYKIKIVKYIQPISTKNALDLIGRKKSQLMAAEKTTNSGDVREQQRKELAQEAADYALKAVQAGNQRYYELAVLIHLEAETPEALENLTDKVKTKLDEKYASSRLALEEMFEGYVSCLPFGENHLVKKYCLSGILTDPLSCFSTFSSLEINHPRGVLYGTDQDTGAPVLLDDTHLDNRHKIILGESGKGKTVLVKAISTRARMRGETCILIDPEGRTRYERVAKKIGGQFTKLGAGSTSKINPFDLSYDYPDLDKLGESIDEDEDPEQALRIAREGAFDSKVTTVVNLIGLMATATDSEDSARSGLTPRQRGRLNSVVTEVYADAGINEDPDTHSKTPPIMPDFFEKLAERADAERRRGDPKDHQLADLYEDLFPWHSGAQSKIFDGHTNVDLRSKYLVVRITAAENGPEKAPLMFVLLDFLRGRLADPRESITCFIDEMWSLLKYPMAVALLNQLWRASRASGTSMVGITQDLDEFLQSEQSSTIMKQSQTYCLLGQSLATIKQIDQAGFTNLSEKMREKVFAFGQGEALLIAGQRQIPINIKVSAEEEELFHTDAANVRNNSEGSSTGTRTSIPAPDAKGSAGSPDPAAATRDITRVGPPSEGNGGPALTNGHSHDHPSLDQVAPPSTLVPVYRADATDTEPGPDHQGRVYTLTGSCAPEVAFSLSGMLSTAANTAGTGGRVLMVDATGSLSATQMFSEIRLPATDDLIAACGRSMARDEGEQPRHPPDRRELETYLIHDAESGLYILRTPEDTSLSAFDLADLLSAHFDSIIVATSKSASANWPRYAKEWLFSSTRLAAVAPHADGLSKAYSSLSQLGEFNHAPLLALAGSVPAGRQAENLPEGVSAADLLTLPPASEISATMAAGKFHPIQHGPESASGAAFALLAYNLDGVTA